MNNFIAKSRGVQGPTKKLVMVAAFAAVMVASTSAMAQSAIQSNTTNQNCTVGNVQGNPGGDNPPGTVGPGAGILGQLASGTAAQIAAMTSNANTIFQAGQGSAFVSAPPNPTAGLPGRRYLGPRHGR